MGRTSPNDKMKDTQEIQKEFERFCNKWDIDYLDYCTPTYTLNAVEQAFRAGYQLGFYDKK